MIPPLRNADTVIITDEELDDIRSNYDDDDEYDDGEYEDYRYGDDRYDDDYDDDYDDGERRGDRDEDVNPGMQKVMKVLTAVVIVIVLFIVIFAIGKAAGVFSSFGKNTLLEDKEDEQIEVPSLIGMTEEEAKDKLKKELGIKVVGSEESDRYEEGEIIRQTPEAGEKVKKNTTIKITVSSGIAEKTQTVPDVSGMDEDSAQKELENKGFKVGTSEFEYDDSHSAGEVIGTTPSAGSQAAEGAEIVMRVSKGTQKKTVPNVVGKKDETAQKELIAAGLVIEEVGYEYDDKVAKGKVVSQSIKAGKKVEAGTSIKIVVSNGKKP